MSINFYDPKNNKTYTTRNADQTWIQSIYANTTLNNKTLADIGCGGGIYTKAMFQLGVKQVTAVDFSEEMLKGAAENCKDFNNITFVKGEAYNTGLLSSSYDIVLERALIHHLDNLNVCFKEANRILKSGGILIVQDRTPEDCVLPGDENHIRGYFFEKFPKLIEKETARRYDSEEVINALESNDFKIEKVVKLWEIRRHYEHIEALKKDLLLRTGRSILHELSDSELISLVNYIKNKLEKKKFNSRKRSMDNLVCY